MGWGYAEFRLKDIGHVLGENYYVRGFSPIL